LKIDICSHIIDIINYQHPSMGYLERLVIGVIVVISAYSLLEEAQQRHHFHNTIT